MSQIPAVAEPQDAGAAPAAASPGTGGSPAVPAAQPEAETLRAQLAEATAKLEALKPLETWRGNFTRAQQSGLADLADQVFAETKNPAAVKQQLAEMRQAADTLRRLGGVERVTQRQSVWEQMGGDALLQPDPAPAGNPAPATAGAPVSDADIDRRVQEGIQRVLPQVLEQRTLAEAKAVTAEELAVAAGLVGADGKPDPSAKGNLKALIDANLARLTSDGQGGRREVTLDDIATAAAQVRSEVIDRLRASGVTLGAKGQPTTTIPPTTNAGGPGAQRPGKTVMQMTPEEINAEIARKSAASFSAQAAGQDAGVAWPSNWTGQ